MRPRLSGEQPSSCSFTTSSTQDCDYCVCKTFYLRIRLPRQVIIPRLQLVRRLETGRLFEPPKLKIQFFPGHVSHLITCICGPGCPCYLIPAGEIHLLGKHMYAVQILFQTQARVGRLIRPTLAYVWSNSDITDIRRSNHRMPLVV